MQTIAASVREGAAITPSDTAVVSMDAMWVGTGGDLVLDYGDGNVTFLNVPGGAFFETQGCIVKVASTASNLVAVKWHST